MEHTRRRFLGSAAAVAAALGIDGFDSSLTAAPPKDLPSERLRRGLGRGTRQQPQIIYTNARVYTIDNRVPRAEAFAIDEDRFLAVGAADDILNLAGPGTQVIDAEGMTIVPGFVDSHSHPSGVNELNGVNVNLRTVEEVKAVLAAKAATTPPGFWVRGYMYDDTKLDRPVTRMDLDEAVPNHLASVGHRGGHTGVYNSMAFEQAGISSSTPDPSDGRFYRENGVFTGKVAEAARNAFNRIGRTEPVTAETRAEAIAYISQQMSAAGLTSVHSAGANRGLFTALETAHARGELRFRMCMFARGGFYRDLVSNGLRTGDGDEWIRIGGVKYAADGSASERTMRMSTPYVGRPDDVGILTMTQEEIHEAVEEAHRARWQIGIHANGDVTIDMVLNAYERMQRLVPRPDPRHRLEHCTLVNPNLLSRIADGGFIPTPFYTYVYYHGGKWGEYGQEKLRWMFAHRSFLDYGIPVPGASDYMPGPYEPMMALQSMVTRTDYAGREWGPNQRVTVDEALKICTLNGAHASFEEGLKGTITEGKLADFVLLGQDPHDVDPSELINVPVVKTVVGGRTMHEG